MVFDLRVVCYINGIKFDPRSVTYVTTAGDLHNFTVDVPAVPSWDILPARSHCVVFFTDPFDMQWRFLCEGEYTHTSRSKLGTGLTHRVVSVTGSGIQNPKNILAPIGTPYGDLIEYCGGLTRDASVVMSGGPMMGFAFTDFSMPITKGTSGITVLTRKDTQRARETACIRCGLCVDVCPMHLVPTRLALAARHRNTELAEKYNIMACMESGCCAYICPANIPLIQLIRMGKAMTLANRKK